MAKNKVNDNGLSVTVTNNIALMAHNLTIIDGCLIKNEQLIKDINREIDSAIEQGYTKDEIKKLIGQPVLMNDSSIIIKLDISLKEKVYKNII